MHRAFTCISLPLLFIFLQVSAQQDTISLNGNWFVGHTYSYGGSEPRRVPGLLGHDALFTNLMKFDPQAQGLFRQSIVLSRAGAGCVGVGVLTALAIVLTGQKQERGMRPGLLLIAAVPVAAGLTLDFTGSRKMKLAASVYNKEIGNTPTGK